MKKQKKIKIEEKANGDLFWNDIPIEIVGDSTLKFKEDEYDLSIDPQIVFTDTPDNPLKKLNDVDRVMYQNFLKKPN